VVVVDVTSALQQLAEVRALVSPSSGREGGGGRGAASCSDKEKVTGGHGKVVVEKSRRYLGPAKEGLVEGEEGMDLGVGGREGGAGDESVFGGGLGRRRTLVLLNKMDMLGEGGSMGGEGVGMREGVSLV